MNSSLVMPRSSTFRLESIISDGDYRSVNSTLMMLCVEQMAFFSYSAVDNKAYVSASAKPYSLSIVPL